MRKFFLWLFPAPPPKGDLINDLVEAMEDWPQDDQRIALKVVSLTLGGNGPEAAELIPDLKLYCLKYGS